MQGWAGSKGDATACITGSEISIEHKQGHEQFTNGNLLITLKLFEVILKYNNLWNIF
jgi:hypothetical protein